ncbi:MAG: response regulator transcription factor [Anaerolineales bacterium]|nr:response regulator transcription factor [Anaerolineales bacterium]
MQALLFSPHSDEAAVLTIVLQQAGFTVRSVRELDKAIEAWPQQPAEFILITLKGDQASALKGIQLMRSHAAVPIVVIVDVVSDDFQVELLEKGADLAITKPYSVRLLLAQIRALLRRGAGMPFFSLPTLTQADLILNPADRTVSVAEGESKRLTQLEFRLLYQLMTHVGQIIPSETIVEHVWGYSGEGNRELVRGLVQRLRSKIEPDPRSPRYILTEPGIGYFFNRFAE